MFLKNAINMEHWTIKGNCKCYEHTLVCYFRLCLDFLLPPKNWITRGTNLEITQKIMTKLIALTLATPLPGQTSLPLKSIVHKPQTPLDNDQI